MGTVNDFFAGEEISWGQRIFEIETPQKLSQLNYQNEINIHNLDFLLHITGGVHVVLALMMIGLGVIMPCLAYIRSVKRLIQKLSFPVPTLCCLPLIFGSFIYPRIYATAFDPIYLVGEISEFLFACGMFLFPLQGIFNDNSLFRYEG